uniref:Uncharacterized protein n=1 Tax=Sarcophilus harrisii TaxID=9305 RepID=G3WMS6_SARHA
EQRSCCPVPPEREAKSKALKAKKAMKGKSVTQRNKLDYYAIIKFSLTTDSAMKKIENNIIIFIVDIKDYKHKIKQAVKKLYDTDVARSNQMTLTKRRSMATEYDALNVANKIGIF